MFYLQKNERNLGKSVPTMLFYPIFAKQNSVEQTIKNKNIMKKSLIAMALMFGAVVFVSSCGDDKPDETCTKCTAKIVVGAEEFDSAVYAGEQCKETWTKEGAAVEGADADAHKGGKYACK
jgi:hypothetical protein